jgi:hypothetical protein
MSGFNIRNLFNTLRSHPYEPIQDGSNVKGERKTNTSSKPGGQSLHAQKAAAVAKNLKSSAPFLERLVECEEPDNRPDGTLTDTGKMVSRLLGNKEISYRERASQCTRLIANSNQVTLDLEEIYGGPSIYGQGHSGYALDKKFKKLQASYL